MARFHNRTRTSASIPARLVSEGRAYLLPLYYLLSTSDLAREGIANSGSYQFADHIYAARPSGRFLVGALLDAILLRLRSARSMRARYFHAKSEIANLIATHTAGTQLRILSVPCGLARELFESAEAYPQASNLANGYVQWVGLDLDSILVRTLVKRAESSPLAIQFLVGDAMMDGFHWGHAAYDMIISTGFTEFLDDARAQHFYRLVLSHLKPSGVMVTSGMRRDPLSDYLLRNIGELHTQYRSEPQLKGLVQHAGFGQVRTYVDGLQTMLIAGR